MTFGVYLILYKVGRKVRAANLDLDAPKHVYIMLFMLEDRVNPDSFFKVLFSPYPAMKSQLQPLANR